MSTANGLLQSFHDVNYYTVAFKERAAIMEHVRSPRRTGAARSDGRSRLNPSRPVKEVTHNQLIEPHLRLLQIARIKPSGKPAVHGGEQFASLIPLTLIAPAPGSSLRGVPRILLAATSNH
jgi:hypothetical protein